MSVEQTIAEWRAEAEAIRARLRPVEEHLTREQIASMTGLEVLRQRIRGYMPPAPIGATLDFMLIEVDEGRAVFQGAPQRHHYNPYGVVHGGWFATVLDSAVGCAAQTTVGPGRHTTTLELKINIVRALTESVQLVRAEGRTLHAGRTTVTAEGRLVGPDGKLYGHASTTCLVLDSVTR